MLILGLGNVLCTDDGVGPAAVSRLLHAWIPPRDVSVVDGGTLGLALASLLGDVEQAILVDAVTLDDAPPGTLVRLCGEDIPPAIRDRLSPHQVGVTDLIDSLRLLDRTPPQMVLLGLVPASLALGVEPTPAVTAALPALVDAIVAEAASLGHPFRRRPTHEPLDTSAELGLFHALRQ